MSPRLFATLFRLVGLLGAFALGIGSCELPKGPSGRTSAPLPMAGPSALVAERALFVAVAPHAGAEDDEVEQVPPSEQERPEAQLDDPRAAHGDDDPDGALPVALEPLRSMTALAPLATSPPPAPLVGRGRARPGTRPG